MEWGAIDGLRVFKHFAFEITNHYAISIMAEYIVGRYWDFATAARGVDDVLRHGVACGVASQLFHNLESSSYTGA